jgi:hypothetical protein
MATKRVSPGVKTVIRRSKKAAQPVLSDGALLDPDLRRQLVAAEAYFLAERRGFAAGGEVEDWIAAEGMVDSRLNQKVA